MLIIRFICQRFPNDVYNILTWAHRGMGGEGAGGHRWMEDGDTYWPYGGGGDSLIRT